jgi:hypothetical protein
MCKSIWRRIGIISAEHYKYHTFQNVSKGEKIMDDQVPMISDSQSFVISNMEYNQTNRLVYKMIRQYGRNRNWDNAQPDEKLAIFLFLICSILNNGRTNN